MYRLCKQCGSDHDDGEFTHWSPFQGAAATYLRATYPQPLGASGATLAAFIYGVTSVSAMLQISRIS